ncbi:MAG: dihydroorotase [Nanoarchaeota archaeon]|nr:dihydroorotase [Nanoarchaeota archaeon]
MYIDPHVHCRDEEQKEKETITHALEVAERAGVDAVFDIVNTINPVTTEQRVEERLEIADKTNSPVFYGLYVLLTPDLKQVEEAVKIHNNLFPRVVGLKLFAGKSVGNLEVIKEKDQKNVYRVLSNNNYEGVLTVHCEKESMLKPELFYAKNPISHSWARPEIAELESIKDQIGFAWDTRFRGKLNIAHVSSPESVEYLDKVRRNLGLGGNEIGSIKVFCEVAPHHLFLYDELMNIPEGLLLKMNPPLRSRNSQQGLLKCLKEGKIDMIATDHAPHTRKEKLEDPYISGIPGLDRWPNVVDKLRKECFSEGQISNLTFNNALKIFGLRDYITKTGNHGQLNLDEYRGLRPQNVLSII